MAFPAKRSCQSWSGGSLRPATSPAAPLTALSTPCRWYQDELPAAVKAHKRLTAPELVKLVEWKVGQRGKWRPRLLDFARALPEGAVADASLRAFAVLSKVKDSQDVPEAALKDALAPLTELKGIGPATASAALSAAHASVPFMSDEAMLAALGSKDYTVKAAGLLAAALQGKARELSGGERRWTAREVEQCLFAAAKAAEPPKEATAKKRKR